MPVFYTGGFYNKIPILFQFLNIFPFLVNPLLTSIFPLSFLFLIYKIIRTKNVNYLILIIYFLLLFLPVAFLFAKWTRYVVPTLPFIYMIEALTLTYLFKIFKKSRIINSLILGIICLYSTIYSISYFITAFVSIDTRIEALNFAKSHIPNNAKIISEPNDLGIIPFNGYTNINTFNFYELDQNSSQYSNRALNNALTESDYIILPSQRILRSRIMDKSNFPNGYAFYESLIKNRLRYKKIYETPCDLTCKITYLGNPIFGFEETVNVFDHPSVFIFKKIN